MGGANQKKLCPAQAYLKVVVSIGAVPPVGTQATVLKSGVSNHTDMDRYGPVSLLILCRRALLAGPA